MLERLIAHHTDGAARALVLHLADTSPVGHRMAVYACAVEGKV